MTGINSGDGTTGFGWDTGEFVKLDYVTLTSVPEPATIALFFGACALGLVVYRRRK
jgi:hypothetical protein